jgi:hypothetical protein
VPREPDSAKQFAVPIIRREDGSIDTDFYVNRARRLRNIRIADALCAIVAARFVRHRAARFRARLSVDAKHE